jgi:two-component system chemotaxis response regulator CheB
VRGHDIIVIGASAGGVQALRRVVAGLEGDLPAAVFVVVHTSPTSKSFLPRVLGRSGPMPCGPARDGEPIRRGRIYVAPPDRHLLVMKKQVRLTQGPRENLNRPAVDPLFRTAARHHGPRVVGVVLTGTLGDGSAGLAAVKARGGVAIVQDPSEALFPDMPLNALREVRVDHCLGLEAISAMLKRLARRPVARRPRVPKALQPGSDPRRNGTAAGLSCPECMGPIWVSDTNGVPLFQCQVGHAFNISNFESGQKELVERALWTAVSALQDKAALARRLEERMTLGGLCALAGEHRRKAAQALRDADVIRDVLLRPEPPAAGRRT